MEVSLQLPPNCMEISNLAGNSIRLPGCILTRGTLQRRDLSSFRNVSLVTKVSGDRSQLRCQAHSVQNDTGVTTKSPFPEGRVFKAVLFDVDGTLCDSDPLHFMAFQKLFQEIGFQGGKPISEEFFWETICGRDIIEVTKELFPDWDEDKRKQFVKDQGARFGSLASEQLKAMEGLETLCQWIKENGLRCAAVSNAPRENAAHMISTIGLADFFEFLIVALECEKSKPHPDPYLQAIQDLGLSPEEIFAFEDSPTGMRAAVAAGMTTVGVATRKSEEALLEAGASLVISNYKDSRLWDVLKSLPKKE